MTRQIAVAQVKIGGGAPMSIQSMTNTDTRDVGATLEQIAHLRQAGCEIVRCSVYDEACAAAMKGIVDGAQMPVVADVHFDHKLGIAAVEQGVAKLRINPGNIGGQRNVAKVAACAKAHNVPIRIGVNSGSVERELLMRYGGPTAQAMVDSALRHVAMLEAEGFCDIAVSLKASSVLGTVQAARAFAKASDIPQHIGVTELGPGEEAIIKAAVGIGTLLLEGIGDTLRISLPGDPVREIQVAKKILRVCGIRKEGVDIIACPTCGRTGIDVEGIAEAVRKRLAHIKAPLTVAVMGCVVNGPGEARQADVGIAAGKGSCALFVRGEEPRKVDQENMLETLCQEAERIAAQWTGEGAEG